MIINDRAQLQDKGGKKVRALSHVSSEALDVLVPPVAEDWPCLSQGSTTTPVKFTFLGLSSGGPLRAALPRRLRTCISGCRGQLGVISTLGPGL